MSKKSDPLANYSFLMKTVQSTPFKILVEALKEILVECNILINAGGVKIQAMDSSHVILIHLKLYAQNFEEFHCKAPKTVGVNMIQLFKLIKTMSTGDTLTLYQEVDDTDNLGILIENGEKNQKTRYKLKIQDISEEELDVPPTEFNTVLTWTSSEFKKVCHDMLGMGAEVMEIKSSGGQLMLTGISEFATQETIIGETDAENGMKYTKNINPDEVLQGMFKLKYLVQFTRCTNLCNFIELYLKNDYPIIIRYKVANLGDIKFCLAPKTEE